MSTPAAELKTWLTYDECADLCGRRYGLEQLAQKQLQVPLPDGAVEQLLARWAHPSLTREQRNLLFDDHVEALRRAAQLDASDITWADVDENLTGGGDDKTRWAREELDTRAEEALDDLLHGTKWGEQA
jgi:hypothetical protein